MVTTKIKECFYMKKCKKVLLCRTKAALEGVRDQSLVKTRVDFCVTNKDMH